MANKKNILITSGPTQEPLDPVRYYSNYSSGKMGFAMAKACIKAGHKVTLISGPTNQKKPKGCQFISVQTAREMHEKVLECFKTTDLVFKVAAVADYRVKHIAKTKVKKNKDTLLVEMVKNPDILKELGTLKKENQVLVGFAAETHEGVIYAKKKLKEKNLDWIALNEINGNNVGFGSDHNEITLISSDGKKIHIPKQPKKDVAKFILKTVLKVEIDQKHRFHFKKFNPISLWKLFKKKKS